MPAEKKNCPICGKAFVTYQSSKTCSLPCRDVFRTRESRTRIPLPPPVEGARWLVLTAGKFTLVDEDLFDELEAMQPWYAHLSSRGYYAVKRPRKTPMVWMHRHIMRAPDDQLVDHWNVDSLDNRRSNLRFATVAENNANRRKHQRSDAASKFKGVSPRYGKWRAVITVAARTIDIGAFASELEAARAYDDAARKHFGAFARLNFPEQP